MQVGIGLARRMGGEEGEYQPLVKAGGLPMKMILQSVFVLSVFLLASSVRLAQAETIAASLTGDEEVPVVSTVASGEFRGFINRDNQSIDYELSYSGLQGTVTTQAHIHVGQP